MIINLIGKWGNAWGAEWLIKEGFEQLGHEVNGLNLEHSYGILRRLAMGELTIVMQGYGLAPKLIEQGQRMTRQPWVLWHAEVMSPEWPTDDGVVLAKAASLQHNAYAYDAIAHNCHCCLETIQQIRGDRGRGRPVFWAPNNGVSAKVHRRLPNVKKKYAIGAYGYLSPRRVAILEFLRSHGISVEYRRPEDRCFGEKLTEFINESHCILNVHYSDSPNTECRMYEAMGCGVPVISEPISMPELFPFLDCAIATFTTPETLLELAEHIVNVSRTNHDYLSKVGHEAMTWLHANASYAQRCENLLKQIEMHLP